MPNLPLPNQLILVKNHAYLVVMICYDPKLKHGERYVCFRDGKRTDFSRAELIGATVVDNSGPKEAWKTVTP